MFSDTRHEIVPPTKKKQNMMWSFQTAEERTQTISTPPPPLSSNHHTRKSRYINRFTFSICSKLGKMLYIYNVIYFIVISLCSRAYQKTVYGHDMEHLVR